MFSFSILFQSKVTHPIVYAYLFRDKNNLKLFIRQCFLLCVHTFFKQKYKFQLKK